MKKIAKMCGIVLSVGILMSVTLTAMAEVDISEFVTVTYVMMGNKPTNGQLEKVAEKWNAILKEKVNAHLNLRWVAWDDWKIRYELLLTSGQPLDLITTATDWLDAWPNAQRGAFMPLDELLPVYAPRVWAEVPPEHWEQCKLNGQIVMIPEDQYTQWTNHGLFYRGDWAREFGLDVPIITWDELGRYLQAVKDKKGVVPWDVVGIKRVKELTEGWVNSHSDMIDLGVPTGAFNVFWGKSAEEYATVVSPLFDGTYVEFAKKMKEWGDAGYWREDVLDITSTSDTRSKLRAGLTGMDAHHTNIYLTRRVEMDEEQPGSDLQMFTYAEAEGRNNLISMSITHGATAIGAFSQQPERALMVYDEIRHNEELYRLFNYGIEGVHYVIEDGIMKRPEGYDEDRDRFSSNFWGGRVDRFEVPRDTVWAAYDEVFARYEKIKKPYPYGRFVFDKTPIEDELAAISDVTSLLGPAIAFGKAGDPLKAVEEMQGELKRAGYDIVMAEVQRQLAEYKRLIEAN